MAAKKSSARIVITRNQKEYNEFQLKGTFSMGQLSAMREACRIYGEESSPVAHDVYSFLTNAFDDFKKSGAGNGRSGFPTNELL